MTHFRNLSRLLVMFAALLLVACSGGEPPQDAAERKVVTIASDSVTTTSHYVPAMDGTRLALDVHIPALHTAGNRYPVLLVLTRYLRSTVNPETGELNPALDQRDNYFLERGYVVVKVDARGSGASFGTRPMAYGPEEIQDAYAVVDWVVARGWADGNVGAYGTSYTGTTAELLAAVNHPAVKAVIPGWSDFDVYTSPLRPYGLLASTFLSTWGQVVGWMDSADPQLGAVINPVDEDIEGSLLKQALREHEQNPDIFEVGVSYEYRDDSIGGGVTWAEIGPLNYKEAIERSGVPMLIPVSWMDAGTADGALLRFQHFSNPQKLVIFAGTHGGRGHASPYTVSDESLPPRPSIEEQLELQTQFFDHHLKGETNEVENWPAIRFFNLGEEAFHETEVWPPEGTQDQTFHLSQGGDLKAVADDVKSGTDTYAVDGEVTTGDSNRWIAQMGGPIVNLDNRGAMDKRMLTYTTEPLQGDLQISGTPEVTLQMSSDREDGMVLVYLEDVDSEGRSRYLTEGGVRLIHRKTVPNPYFHTGRPYHSYAREDAQPMPPGEIVEVKFQLWPISVLIQQGHRVRLAIAGADNAVFDQLPAEGDINLMVQTGGDVGSQLVLPVVEGGFNQVKTMKP